MRADTYERLLRPTGATTQDEMLNRLHERFGTLKVDEDIFGGLDEAEANRVYRVLFNESLERGGQKTLL